MKTTTTKNGNNHTREQVKQGWRSNTTKNGCEIKWVCVCILSSPWGWEGTHRINKHVVEKRVYVYKIYIIQYWCTVFEGGRGGEDVGNVRPEAEVPKVYSTPIQIMICYITLFVAWQLNTKSGFYIRATHSPTESYLTMSSNVKAHSTMLQEKQLQQYLFTFLTKNLI